MGRWGTAIGWIALWAAGAWAEPTLNWAGLVEQFLLLDETGRSAAPTIPTLPASPFGALVHWKGDTKINLCTATHTTSGYVLTAFHCLKPGSSPANYQVIFYDKTGKRRSAAVTGVSFSGDERRDAAILSIDPVAAKEWQVVGGRIRRYEARSIASKVPDQEAVRAWSYTPLQSVPEVAAKYPQGMGMVFRPNRCIASRTVPHLEVFSENLTTKRRSKVYEFYFRKEGVTDESMHLFLDECEHKVVQGNSGSLISSQSDPQIKIGVLHLFVADKEKIWADIEKHKEDKSQLEYFYTGNDNHPKRFAWAFGEFLIASGMALEALGAPTFPLLGN